MHEKFIDYFSRFSPLLPAEADAITASMLLKTYNKRDYLVREGQFAPNTFFILEGCVREFLLIKDEEKTTNFYTENQWAISFSTSPETSVNYNWVCEEKTTVVLGNEERAQELFNKHPRLERISRAIMEDAYSKQKEANTSFHSDSPEQRYLKLISARPDLINRVAQYHIASFIGVKPESLSRIRKRIATAQ